LGVAAVVGRLRGLGHGDHGGLDGGGRAVAVTAGNRGGGLDDGCGSLFLVLAVLGGSLDGSRGAVAVAGRLGLAVLAVAGGRLGGGGGSLALLAVLIVLLLFLFIVVAILSGSRSLRLGGALLGLLSWLRALALDR